MKYLFTTSAKTHHSAVSSSALIERVHARMLVQRYSGMHPSEEDHKNKRQIDIDVPGLFYGTIQGGKAQVQYDSPGSENSATLHIDIKDDGSSGAYIVSYYASPYWQIVLMGALSAMLIVLVGSAGLLALAFPHNQDAQGLFQSALPYLSGIPLMYIGFRIYFDFEKQNLQKLLDKVLEQADDSAVEGRLPAI